MKMDVMGDWLAYVACVRFGDFRFQGISNNRESAT